MNIMLATVTERTREIGIRRALGAKQRQIAVQFLVETVVLSTTGGVAGVALGIGGAAPLALGALSWSLDGWPAILPAFGAALAASLGVAIERWLFFAEARHTVVLYYGARSV